MAPSLLICFGLTLLLAGCAHATDSAPPAGAIADPRDVTASATGEHVHDYWGGKTQVDVIKDYESPRGGAYYSGETGLMLRVRPPEGHIVPQGTGVIEATVGWTLDNTTSLPGDPANEFTSIELWVKTASDAASRPVSAVENGVPLRFDIVQEQADLPHYTISLWEFDLYAVNEGGEGTQFSGSFRLDVQAFRTLELKPFPAHLDRWVGANQLWLKDLQGGTLIAVAPGPVPVGNSLCLGGTCADYAFTPEAGAIVPHDASAVEVTLQVETGSLPVPLNLQTHGADTRAMTDMTKESDSGGTAVFRIGVGPGMGDSPYATQSLWEFRIHAEGPDDLSAWSGSFNLTARALR